MNYAIIGALREPGVPVHVFFENELSRPGAYCVEYLRTCDGLEAVIAMDFDQTVEQYIKRLRNLQKQIPSL